MKRRPEAHPHESRSAPWDATSGRRCPALFVAIVPRLRDEMKSPRPSLASRLIKQYVCQRLREMKWDGRNGLRYGPSTGGYAFVAGDLARTWSRPTHRSCAVHESCWCSAAKPRTRGGRGCLPRGELLLNRAKCPAWGRRRIMRPAGWILLGTLAFVAFAVVGKRCCKRCKARRGLAIAKHNGHASRAIGTGGGANHRHRFRHVGGQLRCAAWQRHSRSRPALQRLADLRVCA